MSKSAILEREKETLLEDNLQQCKSIENKVKLFLLEKFGTKNGILKVCFLWSDEEHKVSCYRVNWWKDNTIIFSKFVKAEQLKDGIAITTPHFKEN